jgi:hypothetical protein
MYMTLRERWIALPWDLQMGWATAVAMALWIAWGLLTGPGLLMLASWCLLFPLLAIIALIIACRLSLHMPRKPRFLVLVAISVCLAITVQRDAVVDMHLVCCVYLAGGPNALNDWAQGLMREPEEANQPRVIESKDIPPRVRRWVPGWVLVYHDPGLLNIECGGGFYHYGIMVHSTGAAPKAKWWHRVVGWPDEVAVYHED